MARRGHRAASSIDRRIQRGELLRLQQRKRLAAAAIRRQVLAAEAATDAAARPAARERQAKRLRRYREYWSGVAAARDAAGGSAPAAVSPAPSGDPAAVRPAPEGPVAVCPAPRQAAPEAERAASSSSPKQVVLQLQSKAGPATSSTALWCRDGGDARVGYAYRRSPAGSVGTAGRDPVYPGATGA